MGRVFLYWFMTLLMGAVAFIQYEKQIQCLGKHSSRLSLIMTSNLSYLLITRISCSLCTKHLPAGWYPRGAQQLLSGSWHPPWQTVLWRPSGSSSWSTAATLPSCLPHAELNLVLQEEELLRQFLSLTPQWGKTCLKQTKVSFSLGDVAFIYDPELLCLISVKDTTGRQMMAHSQVLWALSDLHENDCAIWWKTIFDARYFCSKWR